MLETLRHSTGAELDTGGQMTDAMLQQLARVGNIVSLNLSHSKALTATGVAHLAHLPQLRTLNLSDTAVSDDSLTVLLELPALESLSLATTAVTDAGAAHLARCHAIVRVNLMWTDTGDGAIRALAGKPALRHFFSGNHVSDAGLHALHDIPAYKTWLNESVHLDLLSHESKPNRLQLRGSFTDAGFKALRGLDGLFGLGIDDRRHALTPHALAPLAALPNLGFLAVDVHDGWMPAIADMHALQFLGAQDTMVYDDEWIALSKSRSLEYIWGRRCHNLHARGFRALSTMPSLRGLSVSCLHVDDDAIATLPEFPALRELMPMDIPDSGYRHIAQCENLEALLLMYCRDTTDEATRQIARLTKLRRYFNSFTNITDETPQLLSTIDSLESVTFDACPALTNAGVAALARLPKLRELHVAGEGLTEGVGKAFPARVAVHYSE